MSRGFQGRVMTTLGVADHQLTVIEVADVTDHVRRVRFSGPTFFDDYDDAPATWLRLWVPDPDGTGRFHQRAFTIVAPDRADGTFALDFVVHEPAGPAATWAVAARPGATLTAALFQSTKFAVPEVEPDGYLLIGDAASLPAINSILAVLPEVPVVVLLEQAHDDDRDIPITPHPQAEVRWVPGAGPGGLAAAVEDRDWSDWYAWVAAETVATKEVRTALRERHGFPRSEVTAQAYWVRGRAMGRTREAPEQATPPAAAPIEPGTAPRTPRGWRSRSAGRLLAPVRGALIAAGVVQAVVTLLQLAPYVLLAELATRLLDGGFAGDGAQLWGPAVAVVAVMGVATTLNGVLVVIMHLLDARFGLGVRRALVDKLSRMPLGWFGTRNSGLVKKLVQDDTASLHYLVTHAVLDVVAGVVAPVAVLVYLFTVDARLAAVLLVPLLAFLVIVGSMIAGNGADIARADRWNERVATESTSFLDGLAVLRNTPGSADAGFRSTLDDFTAFLDAWQRPFAKKKTIAELLTRPTTFLLIVAAWGTGFVVWGEMDPATLVPFLLLGVMFGSQLLGIAYGASSLRESLQAARRIGITLGETELAGPAAGTGSVGPDAVAGSVRFDGVGFEYRPGLPVLTDVSLTLRPGTVTALVGPSGSGKSTLAALLARFHDVTAGSITVDGTDIRSQPAEELYRTLGFVFQDVRVLRATVRDNIALARPDATDDQVERAAGVAGIHERIRALPDGYRTVLGEDVRLSGGETQRLAVARALLADPRVLVLDEATAYADPDSEHEVQQALARLVAGRTVLMIAHRLHTVVDADHIVVLDGGRVVQQGTHAALLDEPGRYRSLWEQGQRSLTPALAAATVAGTPGAS